MKFRLLCIVISLYAVNVFGWGQNGHRIVGQIAYNHLSWKARWKINRILGDGSLAMVSTFMDEIRSDPQYDSLTPWHYCTIPDGKTYEEIGPPEEGDVIMAINRFINDLKSGDLTEGEELFALKCLVHLVGDIHQPLHVGNGKDRGGNAVKVTYFWKSSNLHYVWDTGMIEGRNLSYTEYVDWIDHASRDEVKEWQADPIIDWANESKALRPQIYDLPDDNKISYRYDYRNIDTVNRRLLQAGIRLAGVLNDIYG